MADLKRTKIFIGYSRKDACWLERIQVHLKPLVREGLVVLWDDTCIGAGGHWREEIERALDEAAVAILLVSADFLASDFIYDVELSKLVRRAKAGQIRIFPIIIGPCLFDKSPLANFQTINRLESPLSKLPKAQREVVLVHAIRDIMDVLYKNSQEVWHSSETGSNKDKVTIKTHDINSQYTAGQDFNVYTLVNMDSACGFSRLAIDTEQNALLSIDASLVCLDLSIGWEQRQWLNVDYERTEQNIRFDLEGIRTVIYNFYFESEFSCHAYSADHSDIQRIEMTFGSSKRYYEISLERSVATGVVRQIGKTHFQQVTKTNTNSSLLHDIFERLWAFFEPLLVRQPAAS